MYNHKFCAFFFSYDKKNEKWGFELLVGEQIGSAVS
jgi:hypothetical protein